MELWGIRYQDVEVNIDQSYNPLRLPRVEADKSGGSQASDLTGIEDIQRECDSGSQGFYISSGSQNPNACWELGKYLSGTANILDGIPARLSVQQSPQWESAVSTQKAEIYRLALKVEKGENARHEWHPTSSDFSP